MMNFCSCFSSHVDKQQCIICFDDLLEISKLQIQIFSLFCGHVLCRSCLIAYNPRAFLRKKINCPVCRTHSRFTLLRIGSGKCRKCLNKISHLRLSEINLYFLTCGHIFCNECVYNLKSNYTNTLKECFICKSNELLFRLFL
jgi:hypothetical protein